MTYSVTRMYHPSHRVTDLEAVEAFFLKVFGRPSTSRASIYTKPDPKYPNYPTDYCTFTPIADVFFDSIDPKKYVIDNVQRYEDVSEPHLHGTGWAVEGIEHLYHRLVAEGIRSTDQANRPADPSACPVAAFNASKLFYTVADDTGLRYEFYPTASCGAYDPRTDPAWSLPPFSPDDPLGIEFCSHHTILTNNLARVRKLFVDLLHGRVLHSGPNQLRATNSTYVLLADAVYEFAVPAGSTDSYAQQDWQRNAPRDTYHALTWKVRDLSRVARTLAAQGVGIMARSDTMIITEPKQSIGVPWGFTTAAIPNDPRRGAV